MKKQVLVLTLLSTMTLGNITPVFADEVNLSPEASVSFTENEEPEVVAPTDPEEGGVIDPIDPIEPTGGKLSIDFASKFKFGEHEISLKKQTYDAALQALNNEDGTIGFTSNFVQVTDQRPETDGWNLSVKQDRQFQTVEGKTLKGAQITIKNMVAKNYEGQVTEELTLKSDTITLDVDADEEGSGAVVNLLTAEAANAYGTWLLQLGTDKSGENPGLGNVLVEENVDTETPYQATKDIQLVIPANTQIVEDEYTANLVWTLSNTPGSTI